LSRRAAPISSSNVVGAAQASSRNQDVDRAALTTCAARNQLWIGDQVCREGLRPSRAATSSAPPRLRVGTRMWIGRLSNPSFSVVSVPLSWVLTAPKLYLRGGVFLRARDHTQASANVVQVSNATICEGLLSVFSSGRVACWLGHEFREPVHHRR